MMFQIIKCCASTTVATKSLNTSTKTRCPGKMRRMRDRQPARDGFYNGTPQKKCCKNCSKKLNMYETTSNEHRAYDPDRMNSKCGHLVWRMKVVRARLREKVRQRHRQCVRCQGTVTWFGTSVSARVETVKKQIQTFEPGKLYPQQIAEQSQTLTKGFKQKLLVGRVPAPFALDMTQHCTLHTPHSTIQTHPNSKVRTAHCILHTFHISHCTLHTLHSTRLILWHGDHMLFIALYVCGGERKKNEISTRQAALNTKTY